MASKESDSIIEQRTYIKFRTKLGFAPKAIQWNLHNLTFNGRRKKCRISKLSDYRITSIIRHLWKIHILKITIRMRTSYYSHANK